MKDVLELALATIFITIWAVLIIILMGIALFVRWALPVILIILVLHWIFPHWVIWGGL